jgi:hypothetical protein
MKSFVKINFLNQNILWKLKAFNTKLRGGMISSSIFKLSISRMGENDMFTGYMEIHQLENLWECNVYKPNMLGKINTNAPLSSMRLKMTNGGTQLTYYQIVPI